MGNCINSTNEICPVCYDQCDNKTICNHILCKTCFNSLVTKQCPICRNSLTNEIKVDVFDILIEEMNGGYAFELIKQNKVAQLEEWLIQHPADIGITKMFGQTLLHEACVYAQESCVKILIKNGADVCATNNMGVTPLHLACGNPNIEIVSELIKAGADKYAKTNANNTPLDHAKMWKTDNIFNEYLC